MTADTSNKMAPDDDCWLWRSLVTLSSVCLVVVGMKGWLELIHKRIRNRGRGYPNSTGPSDRVWERSSQMSCWGPLSLANTILILPFCLPTWITFLIISRVFGSLSSGSYLHIFLALTAPSTGLCIRQMQIIGLNLLDASSKYHYVRAGWNI